MLRQADEGRLGFDHLMKEFFLQPEYQNVSPDQLVDSASLRDDLWLDGTWRTARGSHFLTFSRF
jgi:hypothetical protein